MCDTAAPVDTTFENKRWVDLDKLIYRTGHFAHEYFTAGQEVCVVVYG